MKTPDLSNFSQTADPVTTRYDIAKYNDVNDLGPNPPVYSVPGSGVVKHGMTKTKRIRQQAFLRHYYLSSGHVEASCQHIGITRTTYYLWLRDPKFLCALRNIDEAFIDEIESLAICKARSGNDRWMENFLRAKGKMRGWNDKLTMEHVGGETVRLELVRKLIVGGELNATIPTAVVDNSNSGPTLELPSVTEDGNVRVERVAVERSDFQF